MNEHWSNYLARLAQLAFLTGLLSADMEAQKKTNPKVATLAQAVVVEIYEHNLGKALDMYRAIAEDEEGTEDTRSQARLRLGKVYLRLGQHADADANFRKAAAGSGAGAKAAAVILAGGGVDDGDLVKAKVRQALAAMRLTGKPDRSDLAWIGQPAVPYVIKAVKDEKADLRFLTNAAGVLLQLGGPKVLEWIDDTKKSDDILRRRAVIKAYRTGDRVVRAKLATFMADADPTVRREVVNNRNRILTAAQFVQALQDTDEGVRSRAMDTLQDNWLVLDHDGKRFENFVAAMPAFEKEPRDFHSRFYFQRPTIAAWLAGHSGRGFSQGTATTQSGPSDVKPSFPATDAGRRAILKAAGFACFRNCTILWPKVGDTAAKNLYANEVATAAKNHEGLSSTILTIERDVLPTWGYAAKAAVFALVERGYDEGNGRLSHWISRYGTDSDINAVATRLAHFDSNAGVGYVCNWMTRVGAPDSVLSQLITLADRYHGSGSKNPPRRFYSVLDTIRSINSKGSIDYIVDNLRRGRMKYYRCLKGTKDAEDERAILRRLLVVPDKGKIGQELRSSAFRDLLRYHTDPGEAELFARAYEIGMGDSVPATDPERGPYAQTPRGVFYTFRAGECRASAESRAKIMAACLATGNVEVFKDVSWKLRLHSAGALAPVLAKYLARCPRLLDEKGNDVRGAMIAKVLRNWSGDDATIELAIAALSHEEASIRSAALARINPSWSARVAKPLLALLGDENSTNRYQAAKHLSETTANIPGLIPAMTAGLADPRVAYYAIKFLGRRDPQGLLAKADVLLQHEVESLRAAAATELLAAHGAKVIDKIGPVILDERMHLSYRSKLIKPFGSLMDLKVVPYLLQALKSPGLQTEAKKQLEAIRFYHEQNSKWSKLVDGSGFTEPSAVEALIKQAKSDNKDIRLAAIASLGTLGDTESLPFLVELVGDKDQDIAKTAKAALARINAADRKSRK